MRTVILRIMVGVFILQAVVPVQAVRLSNSDAITPSLMSAYNRSITESSQLTAERRQVGALSIDGQQRRRVLKGILAVLAAKAFSPLCLLAQESVQPFVYLSAWVPYFNPSLSIKAMQGYGNRFAELSIFAIQADKKGKLSPAKGFVWEALTTAKMLSPKPRILLTITNDRPDKAKDSKLVKKWIQPGDSRTQHIKDLLVWAEKADGLDIDYENFAAGDGMIFVDFIRDLARALHAVDKYLTVAVEPRTRLEGRSFIDWKTLGQHADRVRVMAYQYHGQKTAPGAVAPPANVRELATYALQTIPKEKLEIALPVYGFDWVKHGGHKKGWTGKIVGTLERFAEVLGLRKSADKQERDLETNSGRVLYESGKGRKMISHEVWFEDPKSIVYKVKMLGEMGIHHIGLWQLGAGDLSQMFELLGDLEKEPSKASGAFIAPAWISVARLATAA